MKCPKCGKKLKKDEVCSNCKSELNENSIEDIEQIEDLIIKKNTKLKIFIIFGIILLAIVIISFLGIRTGSSKYDDKVEKIDDDQYIIIKENEKYGYINDDGKVIIGAVYDEADQFIGNYAIVKKDKKYKLIDKSGKVKFETDVKNNIEYIEEFKIWIINENLYDSNLGKLNDKNVTVRYQSDGYLKWKNSSKKLAGIMDYTGKITYKYKLENEKSHFGILAIGSQNDTKDSNKYCVINSDNKEYAIVNCKTGKVIYDYSENFISNEKATFYDIKTNKNYSFVERIIVINDEIVYKSKNKDEIIYNYDNYFTITNTPDRKYLYLSKKDGKITEEQPDVKDIDIDDITPESIMDIKVYKCDVGFGIKSDNGKKLACEWKDIKLFDNSVTNYLVKKNKYYVIAQDNEKYYIINISNNKKLAEFNSNNVIINDGALFAEFIDIDNGDKIVYSLTTNKSKNFDKDSNISLYNNYFTVKKDGKTEYYNLKLKLIYTVENK